MSCERASTHARLKRFRCVLALERLPNVCSLYSYQRFGRRAPENLLSSGNSEFSATRDGKTERHAIGASWRNLSELAGLTDTTI
jgi:hypothetical protein